MEPFVTAYQDALRKSTSFDGRLGLGSYWRFVAANIAIIVLLLALANVASPLIVVYVLYVVIALVPSLTATVRRLHDTGRSGWYVLLGLVPVVGVILLIVATVQSGEVGANAHGEPAA